MFKFGKKAKDADANPAKEAPKTDATPTPAASAAPAPSAAPAASPNPAPSLAPTPAPTPTTSTPSQPSASTTPVSTPKSAPAPASTPAPASVPNPAPMPAAPAPATSAAPAPSAAPVASPNPALAPAAPAPSQASAPTAPAQSTQSTQPVRLGGPNIELTELPKEESEEPKPAADDFPVTQNGAAISTASIESIAKSMRPTSAMSLLAIVISIISGLASVWLINSTLNQKKTEEKPRNYSEYSEVELETPEEVKILGSWGEAGKANCLVEGGRTCYLFSANSLTWIENADDSLKGDLYSGRAIYHDGTKIAESLGVDSVSAIMSHYEVSVSGEQGGEIWSKAVESATLENFYVADLSVSYVAGISAKRNIPRCEHNKIFIIKTDSGLVALNKVTGRAFALSALAADEVQRIQQY